MAGAAVAWFSPLKEVVALSSTEAIYITFTTAFKKAIWQWRLVSEIRIGSVLCIIPLVMYTKNQGFMYLTTNASVNKRTKQVDARFLFCRQFSADKSTKLQYCSIENIAVDVFTKDFGKVCLRKILKAFGLVAVSQGQKAGVGIRGTDRLYCNVRL